MTIISQIHRTILGINVSSTTRPRVLTSVRNKIHLKQKFYIVTPNPEIVLAAQEDRKLFEILNSAHLSLPDGIGLAQAQMFLSLPNPNEPFRRFLTLLVQGFAVGFLTIFNYKKVNRNLNIITGREMFMDLIQLSNRKGWKVLLIGGERGEASGTKVELEKSYKNIKIISTPGPILNKSAMPVSKKDSTKEGKVINLINKEKPHLLFVAFEFPKQEKWIKKWLPKLDIGGAMVVGGTFNYVSGKSRIPPSRVSNSGLEWLYRLINEPWRLKRVFNAFPRFPLAVFRYKYGQ